MPDARIPGQPGRQHPVTVGDALRALPLEAPATTAWPRLARELAPRPRRRRARLWLAAAAALLAALALPRLLQQPATGPAVPTVATSDGARGDATDPLPALVQESAMLESLLAATGEDQVGSGAAVLLRARLEQRIQLVDTLLADPATDTDAFLPLWQERVLLLRGLAGIERGEQVLAANGAAADSTLVLTL